MFSLLKNITSAAIAAEVTARMGSVRVGPQSFLPRRQVPGNGKTAVGAAGKGLAGG